MKLFHSNFVVTLFVCSCLFIMQPTSAEELPPARQSASHHRHRIRKQEQAPHVSQTYSDCPILQRCQADCQNFQNAIDQNSNPQTITELRNILNRADCSCSSKCEGLCYAFYNVPQSKNNGDAKNRIQDMVNRDGCTCAGIDVKFSLQLLVVLAVAYLIN